MKQIWNTLFEVWKNISDVDSVGSRFIWIRGSRFRMRIQSYEMKGEAEFDQQNLCFFAEIYFLRAIFPDEIYSLSFID